MDPTLKAFLVGFVGTLAAGSILAAVNYLFGRRGKRQDVVTEDEKEALRDAKREVIERDKRITDLEKKVAVMESAATPITAAYHAMILSGVRSDDTPALDEVLDKMAAGEKLTEKDLKVRQEELAKLQNDPDVDEAKRIKAKILPDIERLEVLEQKERLGNVALEIVLVSKPGTKHVTAPDGSSQREDTKN